MLLLNTNLPGHCGHLAQHALALAGGDGGEGQAHC